MYLEIIKKVIVKFNKEISNGQFDIDIESSIRGDASAIDSACLIILMLMLEEDITILEGNPVDIFEIFDSNQSISNLQHLLIALERGCNNDPH